ncbi:MAG: undecaprenyldiphospho-muramoylpentapeptide beta-N-acetylglucosaminyltransferase [Alphaproteobacteria bacterium]
MAPTVLIAAGGTAGHLFPAQSLAAELVARGWRIHLATDHRVDAYGGDFPADQVHIIQSATMTRSPLGLLQAVSRLATGFVQSWLLVRRLRPAAAVGFGGYPTLPPILAAARAGVPAIVHDQNAVLGRANRFLAPRVAFVATSVADVAGLQNITAEIVETGNPVRPAVRRAAKVPYGRRTPDQPFNLLVFGGSQGAHFLSELLPAALGRLAEEVRVRLRVVQQCRAEDLPAVETAYAALGLAFEVHAFFDDLPQRIAEAHLIVSRSGASTCAELTAIGRPAIMLPLPGAIDQDQTANAKRIDDAGGGWMIEQADMTADRLCAMLRTMVEDPDQLATAAANARGLARLDAAERLADLVERAAGVRVMRETTA